MPTCRRAFQRSDPVFWTAQPEWQGCPTFIIGGGPSVAQQNLELLRGHKVIVINSSIHVVPWADLLIFADARWWDEPDNRNAAIAFAQCGGLVVSVSHVKSPYVQTMRKVNPQQGLSRDRGSLAVARTSLTAALNLADHKGADPIVLLGADGQRSTDGRSHHHQPHKWPVRPGCWDRQKVELIAAAADLKQRGKTVLNASPGSAWSDIWPVVTLEGFVASEMAVVT